MRPSKNNPIRGYFLILTWTLIAFLLQVTAHAQIFPEVASPEMLKKQKLEQDRKLGQQYYSNQEFDKALEIFAPMYKEDPGHYNYTYYLYCLIGLGEFDEAEKLVKDKARKTPHPRYEVDLGYVYQLADKPDKARKQFDEVLNSMQPNRIDIQNTATNFITRHQYDYAVKAYLKGRELLKGSYTFTRELARAYELTGEYDAMVEAYLDLLEEDPTQLEFVQGRLQSALNRDNEEQVSEQLRQSLLKRNQKDPENRYYGEMLLWLSVQRKDFEFALIQATSLDKRFNEDGMVVYNLGQLCLANDDYDVASEAFQYIIGKGPDNPYYPEALTGDLRSRFLKITSGFNYQKKDLVTLEEKYEHALDELGYNAGTIRLMKDLAHLQAFYLNDLDKAVDMLQKSIEIPNAPEQTIAEIKVELADIYVFRGEVWEAALLYMQVEKAFKNEPIGHLAKYKNARLSFYIGEFDWAKAQLNVLKAATSKLIANDAMDLYLTISDNMDPDSTYTGLHFLASADLLIYQNKDSLALVTLDSIKMLGLYHPLDDEVLYKKAEIAIKHGQYHLADSLLNDVVIGYPYDILADNALFKRARLYEEVFQDKDMAMELYQKLMLDYPGSLFATDARKRYRHLRGDVL